MAEKKQHQHLVEVDVIIPVHNASKTVEETVKSALHQVIPNELLQPASVFLVSQTLRINVCCYDDGSTDSSWDILCALRKQYNVYTNNGLIGKMEGETATNTELTTTATTTIPSRLLIAKSPEGIGRGAGYARNRAAELSLNSSSSSTTATTNNIKNKERFLCLLDSDDIMHPTRVAEQAHGMLSLSKHDRQRTILGCKVIRDPPDSTWHYTSWANGLSDERLLLERFREVTVLQPTWMMCRSRFDYLGGYIEAPPPQQPQQQAEQTLSESSSTVERQTTTHNSDILQLIHPTFDTPQTLRLAEDLRFFHAHLHANGLLRLHRPASNEDPDMPLVTYRHRVNQSQSYQTSRKLLLHLRALAFETCVLRDHNNSANNNHSTPTASTFTNCTWKDHDGKFVVWGAGRDGKDFVKALSEDARQRVYCFVDVDSKKIKQGFYANRELGLKIPIVHFSLLAKDSETRTQLLVSGKTNFGQINKSKEDKTNYDDEQQPDRKKQKVGESIRDENAQAASPQVTKTLDLSILPDLPVVVCVSMYRTNGALERNVAAVRRVEGDDLWHFS